jgi:fructuronate reductase
MVQAATGAEDSIPVSREAYSAWVIADVLPPGTPDLAAAGAVLTADVGAWEKAKLRILNGAHSTFAYAGLLIGHETVADAMDDSDLSGFAARLIHGDIVPSLTPSPLDLGAYAAEIFDRFRNPAIGHRLAQIAEDGSQKLPYRLLDPIAEALAAGRPVARLALPVAAWMAFVTRQARAGAAIVDPLAPLLAEAGRSEAPVAALLGLRQVFPARLAADKRFGDSLVAAAAGIAAKGMREMLAEDSDHG